MYVYTGYLKFQVGIYINEFISLHSHLQRWHKVICIVLCKAVIFIKRIWQRRINISSTGTTKFSWWPWVITHSTVTPPSPTPYWSAHPPTPPASCRARTWWGRIRTWSRSRSLLSRKPPYSWTGPTSWRRRGWQDTRFSGAV